MKRFLLKISLAVVALLVTLASFAQSATTFTTNAPMKASVGETFRIEFALNATPEDNSFAPPALTGFDILAGPAISRGSSIQIINGDMTKTTNYTYTYVVIANSAGTQNIGAASVVVDGKKYSTKALPIEIIEPSAAAASSSGGSAAGSAAQSTENNGSRIAEDDVLLRTVVSRTSLFKGEPLRATIKLYSRVAIAGAENEKMPTFNGFWSQNIMGNSREVQRETYNGKVYDTQILYDYLLYPQQSGKLSIDPASMTVVAQMRVKSRHVDPFFGGGYDIVNVRREISTPKITIDVKELPAGAPASFNGAVGNFSMECSLTPESSIAANSSLSYTVKISGNGNLSLIQAPNVTLPSTIEQYNVKTTESINTNQNGASGYKMYEYPLIPRSEGEYALQPTEFTFFNTKSMKYETLLSPTYNLTVEPDGTSSGDSSTTIRRSLAREDVKLLGEDIRFIKIEKANLRSESKPFILSKGYWAAISAIIALFIALYFTLKHHIKESQNSILVRGKRANKVAIQRFKAANGHMIAQREKEFYKEVLSAIWGYMSDKFNIPVANLTKESVRRELGKRSVSQELITEFSDITTLCDEAQYSPMASAQMNEVYLTTVKLISNIETEIKK